MKKSTRRKIAAGNWKMNLDLQAAESLTDALLRGHKEAAGGEPVEVILGVPFPYLLPVAQKLKGNPRFHLAAQNMHEAEKGAYTGEVSATMLKSVGCSHVIIGHSERRQYFGEKNGLLAAKVTAALAQDIVPIYCFGETLEERENNRTFHVIAEQLREGVLGLDAPRFRNLILAYEPVWAIGTGQTATPEQAQEVHAFVRKMVYDRYGEAMSDSIPILYGGSVNAANAYLLFACIDIDGGLVGGASLKAEEFLQIVGSFL